jgi:hypothetical protein
MASTLYRPNLTADQRDQLLALVENDLNGVEWQDPRFDPLYRLVLKLRDCKPFKA